MKIIALAFSIIGFIFGRQPFALAADKLVSYPGSSFSVIVPSNWSDESSERLRVLSDDAEGPEIAGTEYKRESWNLEDMTRERYDVIKTRMPWYKQKIEQKKIEGERWKGYVAEFEGVWPKETTPFYYVVVTANRGNRYVSLTFTVASKHYGRFERQIRQVITSMKFKAVEQ